VLDAARTLRRPTMSLLGALLPDVPPHEAYDILRPLRSWSSDRTT
jgi:hypothetical protein